MGSLTRRNIQRHLRSAEKGGTAMPTFIIERDIEGACNLTKADLQAISATSNDVVAKLGVPYTWITSYVAGDKIYCVHEAPSADIIREHAERGGFPANKITEVSAIIGPATAMSSQ
jgi:hypothetical protein